jgi:hypothetical protein
VSWRALGAGAALSALLAAPVWAASSATPADLGESIYRRGVVESGGPLQASRDADIRLTGAAAACVNCHQRSGLGMREGNTVIPPITGRYLFRPRLRVGADSDVSYVAGMRGDRDPYSDATLARAIRDGLDAQGHPLSYLMPRFALTDTEMSALIGYLKHLDRRRVPGVTDSTMHFATIITPDADPAKRRGMLAVMKQFFADRNSRQLALAPELRTSAKTAYAKSMFRVHLRWELHVWELTGPESTWQQQLEKLMASQPVFAILSGLAGKNWAPVHAFCEHSGVPCLFPNVEVPVDDPGDFYSLYFSKGVLLEAELMARSIAGDPGRKPTSVLQVYRSGDSGEAGAAALSRELAGHGIATSNRALPPGAPGEGLARALRAASGADTLVLWLRPGDLAALGDAPAGAGDVYASGLMGGLERAPLPAAWRARTTLAYPIDLPEKRRVRVDFALGWFRLRQIPLVADQVQVDTYLACGLVSETLNHMADTFVRDYLVERMQSILEHRIVTGYYPRLTLATGQHFASKGGYLVKWADPAGARLRPEGDWVVP